MAQALMFQGTGSGVGKSIVTAGFCRLLSNQGKKVAPFKAQNMALNSGVTQEGLEMGRAQFLQAEAARIAPDVRMNPILLKPQGNHQSQLIRMGKVTGTYSAQEYYQLAQENLKIAQDAFDALAQEYDYVVMEGAGSPAEINLQKTDITNMRMAAYAQASVFLIGDIDRGGVFAWLKGTYDLIQEAYKPLLKGFLINKFRGDFSLLQPGIDMFEELVPLKTVGTLPYLKLELEDEDSQNISSHFQAEATLKIGVIRLPYISNFTDFSPFKVLDDVSLQFVESPKELDFVDMIILPGSKNTIGDLTFLKKKGFFEKLQSLFGKKLILGICGGYQMLGQRIADPQGLEGNVTEAEGLGFIGMETVLGKEKVLENRFYHGQDFLRGIECSGYEIHLGTSHLQDSRLTQLFTEPNVGVFLKEKKLLGTYIHGLFDHPALTQKICRLIAPTFEVSQSYFEEKQQQLDHLAKMLEQHCHLDRILP